MIFPTQMLRATKSPQFIRGGGQYTRFLEDTHHSWMLPEFVLGITYAASFQNWSVI